MKPRSEPQPCRVCGEPVIWASGLSNRVHGSCRAKEAAQKRAKPERAPLLESNHETTKL